MVGQLLPGLGVQHAGLHVLWQPRQDGVANGGGISRHAAANADIHAKPRQPGLDPFRVQYVRAIQHADGSGFIDLPHQRPQDGPGPRAQVGMGDGVEAKIQHLQRQPEQPRVRHALHVADIHQRVEEAKGRGIVQPRAARDFRHGELGLLRRERFEDAEALRQRLHRVLGCVARAARLRCGRDGVLGSHVYLHCQFLMQTRNRVRIPNFSLMN